MYPACPSDAHAARRLVAAALLGASLPGCFQATFEDPQHPQHGEERAAYRSYFLLGLVGGADVDIRDYCRSGQAHQVRTAGNLGTALISVLTLGIYTPRMIYVTCAPGPEQP